MNKIFYSRILYVLFFMRLIASMAAKKKNHTVTRGYLTGWKAAGPEGRNGLWYFDLEKGEVFILPKKY